MSISVLNFSKCAMFANLHPPVYLSLDPKDKKFEYRKHYQTKQDSGKNRNLASRLLFFSSTVPHISAYKK